MGPEKEGQRDRERDRGMDGWMEGGRERERERGFLQYTPLSCPPHSQHLSLACRTGP
jgi:hypothetical protein